MLAVLTFHYCRHDSQEYGSDDDHMVSRLFFAAEIAGRKLSDLHVDIKQQVGSTGQHAVIEVGSPTGYEGSWNQSAFVQAATQYYRLCMRQLFGANPNAKIRMRDCLTSVEWQARFEIPEESGGW